jgi:hypothetical protein
VDEEEDSHGCTPSISLMLLQSYLSFFIQDEKRMKETGSRDDFLYLKACKLGREIEIFSSQCNGLKS